MYRYRRVSTAIQRQQTKWAIAGLVAVLIANQLFWLPSGFTPLGQTLYMPVVLPVLSARHPGAADHLLHRDSASPPV